MTPTATSRASTLCLMHRLVKWKVPYRNAKRLTFGKKGTFLTNITKGSVRPLDAGFFLIIPQQGYCFMALIVIFTFQESLGFYVFMCILSCGSCN